MTQYPSGWSVRKQEKKAREAMRWLLPGETPIYQFGANSTRPLATDVVVTDLRVFTYTTTKQGREVMNSDIASAEVKGSSITVEVTSGEPLKLSFIDADVIGEAALAIEAAAKHTPPAEALEELDRIAEEDEAIAEKWDGATIVGKVRGKSYRSIGRLSQPGEVPWLVIGAGFAYGVLAAFEDRLVIIKTGAATSFIAGALGGERATTFYYTDITAIEYNSGLVTGVLEVLTPSYQGSANKDYWRGTTASRNANSNDPFTLSNTLPMAKPDYIAWTPHIQALRAKIAEAKRPAAPVVVHQAPAAPLTSSLADELGKLAALRDAGVLSDDEFAAAKAQLIGG